MMWRFELFLVGWALVTPLILLVMFTLGTILYLSFRYHNWKVENHLRFKFRLKRRKR